VLVVTCARGKRTRGYPFARSKEGASFFSNFFFFPRQERIHPGKDTHFCAVILLSSVLSLLLHTSTREQTNVYDGLILKENAAKETTNLEKVAVVRIGKAVCKANDMVVLL